MSFYDGESPYYDESDWQRDADSDDVARLRQEARDLEDVTIENTPRTDSGRCCQNPTDFRFIESLTRDLDTGYLEGGYYECITCGSNICEEDYASIVKWAESAALPAKLPPAHEKTTPGKPGKVA